MTAAPTPRAAGPRGDRWIRRAAVSAVIALAGIAFVVSYRHLLDLATLYGEAAGTAWLFPLSVDGLIVVTSLIMLHCARSATHVPLPVRLALWLGIIATLTANAAHGISHGPPGALVSGWSAVALVIAYELLMWLIRAIRRAAPQPEPTIIEKIIRQPIEVPVEVVREVRTIPRDRYEAARWEYEQSLQPGHRRVGRRPLSDRWRLTETEAQEIQAAVDAERAAPEPEPATETPLDPPPLTLANANGNGPGGPS